jgi:hypothetical protein
LVHSTRPRMPRARLQPRSVNAVSLLAKDGKRWNWSVASRYRMRR